LATILFKGNGAYSRMLRVGSSEQHQDTHYDQGL